MSPLGSTAAKPSLEPPRGDRLDILFIANRGEVAVRIARTARDRGLFVIMAFTAQDRGALHTRQGDLAVLVPDYLDGPALVAAAQQAGAQRLAQDAPATRIGVHPGYGFLAESADFARQVIAAGLVWVGPPPQAMAVMGDKAAARRLVAGLGLAVALGTAGADLDDASLAVEAALIGFPIMVKAAAGGGGKGMKIVRRPDQLEAALAEARRVASAAFGDDRLLLERYVADARHVEVQVLADSHGTCLHLYERECSLQRRHQKVIEEAPSPSISPEQRAALCRDAVQIAQAVGYQGAGTVEFLLHPDGQHHFLEMNTRLQVEHAVTEEITGLDLVGLQLFVAEGGHLPASQDQITVQGWAMEARIYAEDPVAGWLPSAGRVDAWWPPPGVRVDSGVATGSVVGTRYDPMLAKVIAHGRDRDQARHRLLMALRRLVALGPMTNRGALVGLLQDPRVVDGRLSTQLLDDIDLSVLKADWPALCAVLAAEHLARRARRPLPEVPAGWRNNRWRDAELVIEQGSEQHRLRWRELAPGWLRVYRAPKDEAVPVEPEASSEVRARLLPAGVEVEVDGVLAAFAILSQGDLRLLACPQGDLRLRLPPSFVAPGSAGSIGAAAGSLTAPLTGTVVQVAVAVGDAVQSGQVLVVLEAMKMEQSVQAPWEGVVATVQVVPNQQVDQGQVLVVIDASPDSPSDPPAPGDV